MIQVIARCDGGSILTMEESCAKREGDCAAVAEIKHRSGKGSEQRKDRRPACCTVTLQAKQDRISLSGSAGNHRKYLIIWPRLFDCCQQA
jgi:hypothetical protein